MYFSIKILPGDIDHRWRCWNVREILLGYQSSVEVPEYKRDPSGDINRQWRCRNVREILLGISIAGGGAGIYCNPCLGFQSSATVLAKEVVLKLVKKAW